jgi:hypothetical protein
MRCPSHSFPPSPGACFLLNHNNVSETLKDSAMYTIRGLLDDGGSGSILASAKDWEEAKLKARDFRNQGNTEEIWKNANLMAEHDYD